MREAPRPRKAWRDQTPIERVLGELCTKYGFCLQPTDEAAMIAMPTVDVDGWTHELFRREGLDAPYDRTLWRQVRSHVERRLAELS